MLDALRDDDLPEKIAERGVYLSRWVSFEQFCDLMTVATDVSGASIPNIRSALTSSGWCSGVGSDRTGCVVMSDAWVAALASLKPATVMTVTATWSHSAAITVESFLRRPLAQRAAELFALCRSARGVKKIVMRFCGSEPPLPFDSIADSTAQLNQASLGNAMQFLAGEGSAIGAALEGESDYALQQTAIIAVDFSFHLTLDHIDRLVGMATPPGSVAPRLSTSSQRSLHGDSTIPLAERERSADVLAPGWVEIWAALPDARVEPVTRRWASTLDPELNEPQTQALILAVTQLKSLCTTAKETGLDVVFDWQLD